MDIVSSIHGQEFPLHINEATQLRFTQSFGDLIPVTYHISCTPCIDTCTNHTYPYMEHIIGIETRQLVGCLLIF